jgi:glycosyltransferase involved in cell wall biosynthesis
MFKSERGSKSILCIGTGWFPKSSGGLERYIFELTHQLVENKDGVEFCGVGLPETFSASPIKLTNLCEPNWPIWQRLWSIRHHFLTQARSFPDAINLHFALYSLPLIFSFPSKTPLTFTFHGPWAFESGQEGGNSLSIFVKQWIEERVYGKCDCCIVLSKAFGIIFHETYRVPEVQISLFSLKLIHCARSSLNDLFGKFGTNFKLHPMEPIILTPRHLAYNIGFDKLLFILTQIKKIFFCC